MRKKEAASTVRISQIVQWLPAPSILQKDFVFEQNLVVTLRLHQSLSHPGLNTDYNKHDKDCEKWSIVTTSRDINCLIKDLEGGTHSWFDVQNFNVLPVFLQEWYQEIDGKLHIEGDVVVVHGHVGNAKRHAHDFLHLELDGGYGSKL